MRALRTTSSISASSPANTDGYEVELREYDDYVRPNTDLADGALSANFFQHIPYLADMNRKENLGLAWIAKVHIEPLGLYSKKNQKFE